ncbi:MAG: hypothetical protein HQK59_13825, partial [Deltaproteobacteria bacterium]|nr:hypothetical protein [Deltaproteobacteria bacterium]
GERIGRIVKTLLSYARDWREEKKPTRSSAIVEESIILTQALIRKEGIGLKIDIPDDLPEVKANFQQIQQDYPTPPIGRKKQIPRKTTKLH